MANTLGRKAELPGPFPSNDHSTARPPTLRPPSAGGRYEGGSDAGVKHHSLLPGH